jgi:hypothetical protein
MSEQVFSKGIRVSQYYEMQVHASVDTIKLVGVMLETGLIFIGQFFGNEGFHMLLFRREITAIDPSDIPVPDACKIVTIACGPFRMGLFQEDLVMLESYDLSHDKMGGFLEEAV